MRSDPCSVAIAAGDSGNAFRDPSPVVWALDTRRPLPISDTLAVTEAAHRAVLALAGRHFGADAIPSALSGRDSGGRPLCGADQHAHKHVLIGSADASSITHLAVWAPGGMTAVERRVVAGIRLPYAGRFVVLTPMSAVALCGFAAARVWRSLTPYVPFNHLKQRGRNSLEGQIRRELVEFRRFAEPESVSSIPWKRGAFRLGRNRDTSRTESPACPFELCLTFAEPVTGPVVLGRHAHYSLGLMVPSE